MKLRILFFSLLFCLLSTAAHAQCIIQAQASYTIGVSWAENDNSDGTYDIMMSTVVEGSSTMQMISGQYPCPQSEIDFFNAGVPNIQHTPSATAAINGHGGTTQGAPFCAVCYSSYQVNADSGPLSADGQQVQGQDGGEVDCGSVGTLLYVLENLKFERAFTRFLTGSYFVDTSGAPHLRYYNVTPYCTPDTSPPDWTAANPKVYWVTIDPPTIPTDIVDGKTICARWATGPWHCAPVGKFTNSYAYPYLKGLCTHNP